MSWIQITPTENIPAREGRAMEIGGLALAIFNTGDRYLAIENKCPHAGGPLADGIVGGTSVTCPLHNWRVCLESGELERPCGSASHAVRTFATKVENGIVLLALDELQSAA